MIESVLLLVKKDPDDDPFQNFQKIQKTFGKGVLQLLKYLLVRVGVLLKFWMKIAGISENDLEWINIRDNQNLKR